MSGERGSGRRDGDIHSGVSERRGSTTTYSHSGLKNVEPRTGSGQTVTADRQYDAFGLVVNSSGTWNQFGYAGGFGYQEEADHGLKLLGHRYYDPSTGRFLTRDIVKDGRNWYSYCDANPLSFLDVNGLNKWKLYRLLDNSDNFLKWGHTVKEPPERRYGWPPSWERAGRKMDVVAEYDNKTDCLRDERYMVKNDPGPLNKEPWAGSGGGMFSACIGALREVVEILDPTPIGLGMGAAEVASEVITPYVEDRKDTRAGQMRWWLDEQEEFPR